MDGVSAATLGWGSGQGHYPFGESWRFPGYRNQIQGDHHHLLWRWGRAMALQEN